MKTNRAKVYLYPNTCVFKKREKNRQSMNDPSVQHKGYESTMHYLSTVYLIAETKKNQPYDPYNHSANKAYLLGIEFRIYFV